MSQKPESYKLEMGDDGILRPEFSGDMTAEDAEVFFRGFRLFVESATEAEPLDILALRRGAGKFTSAVRKFFVELNAYPQIGRVAVLQASRYGRVLVGFILKATGRTNVRFFDSEKEALTWLKTQI